MDDSAVLQEICLPAPEVTSVRTSHREIEKTIKITLHRARDRTSNPLISKSLLRLFDVWRGVWRCTHAKLAPLTPHPLARDRLNGPASRQRRELLAQYCAFVDIILYNAHNKQFQYAHCYSWQV